MAEAQLLDEAIRRGREASNGSMGRRPIVPSSHPKKPAAAAVTLTEFQEQLRRKRAVLADRSIVDELPDKGARIRASVADLEKRIAALQPGTIASASTDPLEERMKILSLGGSTPTAAPSASQTSPTTPSDEMAVTRIPNPFRGSAPAPPAARQVRSVE